MVIWMNDGVIAFCAAEDFDCTVSDNFVCCHICSCACTTLDWVTQELIMELASDDLVTSLADCIFDLNIQLANLTVADCTCFFDLCHGVDELWLHSLTSDVEVFTTTHRLYAIVSVYWNLFFADRIFFNTIFHDFYLLSFLMSCLGFVTFSNIFDANPASFDFIIAGVRKKSSVFSCNIPCFDSFNSFFCNLSIISANLCTLFLLRFFSQKEYNKSIEFLLEVILFAGKNSREFLFCLPAFWGHVTV